MADEIPIAVEPQSTIVATCQQTRFYLLDDIPASKELVIPGLQIAIQFGDTGSSPAKRRSKKDALDILIDAELILKGGICYGLVGRNGTGKSTILRAVAEKLIPSIPYKTKIGLLQQSLLQDNSQTTFSVPSGEKSVLQYVIDSDTSRNTILREIDVLSKGIENGTAVHALRSVRFERLKRQLFEVNKNATLRSGARGWKARIEQVEFEKVIVDAEEVLKQDLDEISDSVVQSETEEAVALFQELQAQFESENLKASTVEAKARKILLGIGFIETTIQQHVSTLSGGWLMRCWLASVLFQPCDILILDEPTNFMDLLGIIWLQHYIISLRGQTTVVLVSHDRTFVDLVTEETIILRDHKLTYFRGNMTAFEETTEEKKLYLGRMRDAQDRKKAVVEKSIAENIKRGKASGDDNMLRAQKSRQRKVDEHMGMNKNARGGRFKLNRDRLGKYITIRDAIEVPTDERDAHMSFPGVQELRFPGPLVSLEKVSFKYTRTAPTTIDTVDLVVHSGDRFAVLGLNGSGKSTLIKLMVDELKPTTGVITKHPRLKIGYYSQHAVDDLQAIGASDASTTALSLMLKTVGSVVNEGEVRGLLGAVGLQGRTVSDVSLRKLSGGQLVRLALCLITWDSPHMLVLDEPSTHLDFSTITALIDALSGYEGAILLVSHDRYVVRRVVEDENDEEEDEDGDEKKPGVVFKMLKGKLVKLDNGIEQFETSLEKRVNKIINS